MIDVIILSYAKTKEFEQLTKDCIKSLYDSEQDETFNVIVVESMPGVIYYNAQTIHPNQKFNYNKFANIGISHGKSEWVCVCNNDLIFHKGWATELLKYGFNSMSPKCPNNQLQSDLHHIHLGFDTARHISGWCLFLKRTLWDFICGFDEDFEFWCADDSYREQLKFHNQNHYLIATSLVTHLGSATLKTIDSEEKKALTIEQARKFNKKYKKDLFGLK